MEGMPELHKGYYWKITPSTSTGWVWLSMKKHGFFFDRNVGSILVTFHENQSKFAEQLLYAAEELLKDKDMHQEQIKLAKLREKVINEFNNASNPIPFKGPSF